LLIALNETFSPASRAGWPAVAGRPAGHRAERVAGPATGSPEMRYPVGMRFARLLLT
jgi:hypothetical protein